jgi:hypothetical protein
MVKSGSKGRFQVLHFSHVGYCSVYPRIPQQPGTAVLPSYRTASATVTLHNETAFSPNSFR